MTPLFDNGFIALRLGAFAIRCMCSGVSPGLLIQAEMTCDIR